MIRTMGRAAKAAGRFIKTKAAPVMAVAGVVYGLAQSGVASAASTFPDATITVDPTAINTNVGSVFNTAFGTGVTVIGLMIAVGFILKGLRARKG